MNMVSHTELAAGRWQKLSLLEQMANIESEVGRAILSREKGMESRAEGAAYRALELFDFSLNDPKLHGRLREIARAREVFADFFFGENAFGSTGESLQKYFFSFAVATRKSTRELFINKEI